MGPGAGFPLISALTSSPSADFVFDENASFDCCGAGFAPLGLLKNFLYPGQPLFLPYLSDHSRSMTDPRVV